MKLIIVIGDHLNDSHIQNEILDFYISKDKTG